MMNIDEWTITQAFHEAQQNCTDARLKHVLGALVTSLHTFAREVRLTEDEWMAGIRFLTEAGHITDAKRQEFILLSDVLGLSTLVTAQNHAKPEGCTEATVLGPFFVDGAPHYENGDDISNGAAGQPCYVTGTVRGAGGEALGGAALAIWQSDEEGLYDVQHSDLAEPQARGNLRSLPDGSFHFRSILAEPYAIPHDGPVGKLLERLGRHPWRPAHLHFKIEVPGFETLTTHIFRNDGPYLDSDAVFGVRSSLIDDWVRHDAGTAPDGSVQSRPYYTVHHDFVLNPVRHSIR